MVLVGSSPRLEGLLAGIAYTCVTTVVLAANLDRQRRALPTRLTAHRLMFVGLACTLGLTTLAFFWIAVSGEPPALWAYDIPLLVGIIPAAVGMIWLCWPPGTTRREGWLIAGDGLLTAVALLVIWFLVVIPADPPEPANSIVGGLADLAPWAQYLAVVAIVVVASASRRPGALAIQQLVLLQLSVLVYVNADIYQHLFDVNDPRVGTIVLVVGALVAAALYRAFAARPSLEDEDVHEFTVRTIWSAVMPSAVLVSMGISVAVYRVVVGPLPGSAVVVTVVALTVASIISAAQRVLLAQDAEAMRMAKVKASLQESADTHWFTALLGQAHDLVTVVDRRGLIVFQTPSVRSLFGFDQKHLLGHHASSMFRDTEPVHLNRLLQQSLHVAQAPVHLVLIDAHGDPRETETVITPLRADGADGYVLTTRDVSDRLRLRAALAESEHRDELTGLPNRSGFLDRLDQLLSAHDDLAVVLIDVVGFRTINDTRGHDAGDTVLRAIASAIQVLPVRVAAGGRIGADEFGLVLATDDPESEVGIVDRSLREALNRVVLADGSTLSVAICLGYVTRLPINETGPALMERADLALASARTTSARGPMPYERGMRSALLSRVRQEADLREAIDGDRLVVHYQPIIDLGSGRVAGLEALVRLRGADAALIPPDAFIPQAEELGLIGQIGARVLDRAIPDVLHLQAVIGRPLTVAVNLSAAQIEPGLPAAVGQCLARYAADPSLLTLEVTESSLVRHATSASVLGDLRRMGCAIAIDDFGTGYSSLSYLVGLPVDELKIDRSFINQLAESERSLSLVRVLLQMASTLGLTVVAEGVETVEQADLLRGMGCQKVQGYLYSAPLSIEQLQELVSGPASLTAFKR